MFIKLTSDQVDDLIVKELTETYANYDEGWFDDGDEMQEALAKVLSHFMTATEYDIWSRKINSKKALDEMVRHNEELGLYTKNIPQDEYASDIKREWVGLTEYDIQTIEGNTRVDDFWATKKTWNKRFAKEIEDTLRRRNT